MGLRSERLFGILWGVLFTLYPIGDYFLRPKFVPVGSFSEIKFKETPPLLNALFIGAILMTGLLAAAGAARFQFDLRRSQMFGAVLLPLALVLPLSLFHGAPTSAVVYIILISYVFLASYLFTSTNASEELFRSLLAAVVIGHSLMLIVALIDGGYSWGRLAARAGPNYWGMIATITATCAIVLKRIWLRVAVIALSCAILVLTSSRGSMLAVAAAGSVMLLLAVIVATPAKRVMVMTATVGGGLIVLLAAGSYILDDVLKVSDPQRGLGSGGTGRVDAWLETIKLFVDNPFLGVGYRQHERMITAASSAHNAYLATAAETGLIGLVAYLALIVGATVLLARRILKGPARAVDFAALGFMISFLVAGMVERQALNTGNSYSMLMLFVTGWAFSRRPVIRGPAFDPPRSRFRRFEHPTLARAEPQYPAPSTHPAPPPSSEDSRRTHGSSSSHV